MSFFLHYVKRISKENGHNNSRDRPHICCATSPLCNSCVRRTRRLDKCLGCLAYVPSKLSYPQGDLGFHLIHCSLGPTRVARPPINGILIAFSVCAQVAGVPNKKLPLRRLGRMISTVHCEHCAVDAAQNVIDIFSRSFVNLWHS